MTSTLKLHTALRYLAVTAFVCALATGNAFAGQTARSTGNGAYINVSGTDTSGCVWFYVYASKGGTTQAPETYMYYDIYNQCTGQWVAYGGGRIANSALKATKTSATLVVSPAGAAGFTTEGYTGSLNLKVTADGLYSSTYSGHAKTEYTGHMYQSHGSWTSKSATATGSLLGFDLAAVSASIGEGRDKAIEIERGSH
jgi:hypothetical protein